MKNTEFIPDCNNILQVLYNRKPKRLPLYEHHIDVAFISKAMGGEVALQGNKELDFEEYYRKVIGFWRDRTFDAFDY